VRVLKIVACFALLLGAEEEEQDQREDEGAAEPDTELQQGQWKTRRAVAMN